MAKRILPPQDFLCEAFAYDPLTGAITWRERPAHHFKSPGRQAYWNRRLAGRSAISSRHKAGHGRVHILGKDWLAHRIIWRMVTGEDVPMIDHEDRDPTNNRWENLRTTTPAGNCQNRGHRNKWGYKGVFKIGAMVNFGAQIRIAGKHQTIGYYPTPEQAHAAYCAVAREHFGKFWSPG